LLGNQVKIYIAPMWEKC